jgi:hypothetical protein
VIVGVGGLAFYLARSRQKAAAEPGTDLPGTALARIPKHSGKQKAVHSCNVLRTGAEGRRLWQFDARGAGFNLNREESAFSDEPLPHGLIAKDWTNLYQPRLNVAWLPPEQVFLRVAQFPRSDFAETVAMVELQLEKLSPMPVAQVVWSIQVLPHLEGNMQTIIVMIAARDAVEQFLGKLEGQGYMADRLEIPLLDQLQATAVTEDGAWIYPEAAGGKHSAVVAWWSKGVLQNLDLVNLPATNRPASVREQLLQMAWAGEMDGWLSSPPTWHLVAEKEVAAEWEPPLREGLEQPIQVLAPLSQAQLAALTARRATSAESQANLLPPEFSLRYQQQFVDRLWMRGLAAVVGLYLIGLLIYGVAVGFASYRTGAVEAVVADRANEYTNVVHLRDLYQVLRDRSDLKFAALDSYNFVAETLPTEATLEGLNLSEGKRLALQGTAPADKVQQLYDFESAIRKVSIGNPPTPFFDASKSENLSYHVNGAIASWNLTLQLKRVEIQ